MKLLFTPEAFAAFGVLKERNPRAADCVRALLKEILSNPDSKIGRPLPLTGALSGLWCRDYGAFQQIVYSISEEELKVYAIGSSFVQNAGETHTVEQKQYSEDEYRAVLAQMEANRGKGNNPKVGIFWYNVGRDELFGVVSHPLSDYTRANASEGRITCSELHEDVWKKEYYRQRFKNDGVGPYIGQYQDKPRGRVFYHIEDDTFEIAAGKWLQEYPHVYDMILQEFDLPADKTSARYAIHWDIGHSWR